MKKPVDLAHACRLINHGPTVLVTSEFEGRRNVMAAAWSMPVEFVPPRVAVVIDKRTYTRELVMASGSFALCIPCRDILDATYTVGSVSGRDYADDGGPDKFERHGIARFEGPVLGLPLVYRGEHGRLIGFETGSFCLYVEQGSEHGPVFEFLVPDVAAARSRLLAAGCTVLEENASVPRCYIRDPFGLVFNVGQSRAD